jgi:hypothetical protein
VSDHASAFVGKPTEVQEILLNLSNIASFLEKPFFDGPEYFADEIMEAYKWITEAQFTIARLRKDIEILSELAAESEQAALNLQTARDAFLKARAG